MYTFNPRFIHLLKSPLTKPLFAYSRMSNNSAKQSLWSDNLDSFEYPVKKTKPEFNMGAAEKWFSRKSVDSPSRSRPAPASELNFDDQPSRINTKLAMKPKKTARKPSRIATPPDSSDDEDVLTDTTPEVTLVTDDKSAAIRHLEEQLMVLRDQIYQNNQVVEPVKKTNRSRDGRSPARNQPINRNQPTTPRNRQDPPRGARKGRDQYRAPAGNRQARNRDGQSPARNQPINRNQPSPSRNRQDPSPARGQQQRAISIRAAKTPVNEHADAMMASFINAVEVRMEADGIIVPDQYIEDWWNKKVCRFMDSCNDEYCVHKHFTKSRPNVTPDCPHWDDFVVAALDDIYAIYQRLDAIRVAQNDLKTAAWAEIRPLLEREFCTPHIRKVMSRHEIHQQMDDFREWFFNRTCQNGWCVEKPGEQRDRNGNPRMTSCGYTRCLHPHLQGYTHAASGEYKSPREIVDMMINAYDHGTLYDPKGRY